MTLNPITLACYSVGFFCGGTVLLCRLLHAWRGTVPERDVPLLNCACSWAMMSLFALAVVAPNRGQIPDWACLLTVLLPTGGLVLSFIAGALWAWWDNRNED